MSCRILIEPAELRSGLRTLTASEYHYIIRVRRLKVGDEFTAFDGCGRQAAGTVVAISGETASAELAEVTDVEQPRPHFHMLLPLIKGERMDSCITQLVELGAKRITPFQAHRSVVSLDANRAKSRKQRYERIVAAASKQSQRATLPAVDDILELSAALLLVSDESQKLLCRVGAESMLLSECAEAPSQSIAILTGPEGGFDIGEIQEAKALGFTEASLGNLVLRAETAPIAALAALSIHYAALR